MNKVWAVIPQEDLSAEAIKFRDMQIPDRDVTNSKKVNRLRQIIWKNRHLVMANRIRPTIGCLRCLI